MTTPAATMDAAAPAPRAREASLVRRLIARPDGLAGLVTVVHHQAKVVADTALASHPSDGLQQLSSERLVVEVRQPLDMPPGHDEHMERRAREDIVDGHDLVVLVDDGRGDLPRDDATEQAVVHAAKRIATWR